MNADQFAATWALVGTVGYLTCQLVVERVLDRISGSQISPPVDGTAKHQGDDVTIINATLVVPVALPDVDQCPEEDDPFDDAPSPEPVPVRPPADHRLHTQTPSYSTTGRVTPKRRVNTEIPPQEPRFETVVIPLANRRRFSPLTAPHAIPDDSLPSTDSWEKRDFTRSGYFPRSSRKVTSENYEEDRNFSRSPYSFKYLRREEDRLSQGLNRSPPSTQTYRVPERKDSLPESIKFECTRQTTPKRWQKDRYRSTDTEDPTSKTVLLLHQPKEAAAETEIQVRLERYCSSPPVEHKEYNLDRLSNQNFGQALSKDLGTTVPGSYTPRSPEPYQSRSPARWSPQPLRLSRDSSVQEFSEVFDLLAMEAEESVEVQAADGGLDVEESPVEPTSDSPTDEHVADVEPTVDVDQSPVSEIEVVNDSVGPEAPEPSADQPEVAEEPAADEPVATEESAGGPVEEVEEPDAAVVPQEPPRPSGAPPTFITELTNVEFSAGNALMLMAQVTGDPVPDASWTRNGETIDLSGRVAVENDSGTLTLTVTLSDPRDAGQYCVVAYNEHGRANSEAEVILQKPPPGAPVFTENVVSVIQLPTGSAEFSARITGQPKPKVHWQFNDKPIKAGASYKLERDEDLCTLHIPECGAEMAGRYACVAKNSAGLARSEATLQVVDELPVEKPTPAVVEEPAVQTPSTQPLHQDQAHQAVASSETSAINPSKPNGEAPRSAVDEPLYEPIQRPAKPASKECPFFLKTIGDTEVFSGMQARFTACVTGSPPPEYEWCRNGIRIYPSERIAMDMDNTGVIRLVMRNVDSTDAGRYKLRVYNQHGEASCEADLTYDSFDVVKTRPLKDQYQTLEWQLKSGVPMPLVDPPIISRMTDCQLTLSWRPSPPAGQPIPVTYQVEMSEPSSSEWSTIRTGVRGCSIEVKHLQPDKDYRFHIKVENKYGVSEPSSHVTTQRDRLLAPLEYCEKFLPAGERFRPDLSTRFPKDFDMERWNRRRPQPPTVMACDEAEDDGANWRYARFSAVGARAMRSPLPDPDLLRPTYRPLSCAEADALRPDTSRPPSAVPRALTDDVAARRSPISGRLQRQQYADEWETRRGAHIVERMLVRRQVEDAGRSFRRSAGYDTRDILRHLPARRRRSELLDFTVDTDVGAVRSRPGSRQSGGEPDAPSVSGRRSGSARDWQGEFERHIGQPEDREQFSPKPRTPISMTSVSDWETRFLDEFGPSKYI